MKWNRPPPFSAIASSRYSLKSSPTPNVDVEPFPDASVAVTVTTVRPSGNTVPAGGAKTTAGAASKSSDGENARPIAGARPSIDTIDDDTRAPRNRSGSTSPPVSVNDP